jgi:hypothetical protein
MGGVAYSLWLGLLAALCVGGWLVHRQFEDARRERKQIVKAIDFLEREMNRMRERLPLTTDDHDALAALTARERPDRDSDFK